MQRIAATMLATAARPAAAPRRSAVPRHVAIIMDGNGRWAAQRGLPRISGHQHGTDNIRRITTAAAEIGIEYLTLWAFSTDNWRRPREEIDGILRILAGVIERETDELDRQGAQLRHIGSLEGLDPQLQAAVLAAIDRTRSNNRLILTLAFNYSGRQELLAAIKSLMASGVPAAAVDEETLASPPVHAGPPRSRSHSPNVGRASHKQFFALAICVFGAFLHADALAGFWPRRSL